MFVYYFSKIQRDANAFPALVDPGAYVCEWEYNIICVWIYWVLYQIER